VPHCIETEDIVALRKTSNWSNWSLPPCPPSLRRIGGILHLKQGGSRGSTHGGLCEPPQGVREHQGRGPRLCKRKGATLGNGNGNSTIDSTGNGYAPGEVVDPEGSEGGTPRVQW